jgi:hypothetical protein
MGLTTLVWLYMQDPLDAKRGSGAEKPKGIMGNILQAVA